MATHAQLERAGDTAEIPVGNTETWVGRLTLLWLKRRFLLRFAAIAFVLSVILVFLIPKRYESTARIMPPEQTGNTSSLLALAGRSSGVNPLSLLASGILGTHSTTALFISLLQSSTVSAHLVEHFQLQHVYNTRYSTDAAKRLARNTEIADDKRSGVITIKVSDRDPHRARDLAHAYLDELNDLVRQTSNSSARQERIFLEQRLQAATADLSRSQIALSDYSTKNNTIDLKEQTRAMVDSAARLEGEIVLTRSTLSSLRQVYGDGNIRVREAAARIGTLQEELHKITGSPSAQSPSETKIPGASGETYPPLRQLPRLGVRYADLYRAVRVQETLFELLTQQYEAARIEEAKDIPAVKVIDAPGVPEKKSYPPRTLLIFVMTFGALAGAATWILLATRWERLPLDDNRRILARDMARSIRGVRSATSRRSK